MTIVRQQVFDSVLNNSPEFFEHLVVDLLLKMGYGYDKNSGIVTGKPHDGGIDGTIQKYRNSLFNFIFIPQPLNSSLSNEGLFIKVAEIHTHENEIKCSYSKGYYGLLNKSPRMYFQRYPTEKEIDSFSTEEDARAYLNEYFTKTFPEEFLQFSTALVKKINWGS